MVVVVGKGVSSWRNRVFRHLYQLSMSPFTLARQLDPKTSAPLLSCLRHRRSRYRARCSPAPPGTCLRPRRGTRSHGTQSQTECRSLIFKRNKKHRQAFTSETPFRRLRGDVTPVPRRHRSPCSQYGSPSSRWKVLFLIGCWQQAHRKQ